jgi:hypothetical protein
MIGPQNRAELEKEVVLHPILACYDPPDPMRDQWRGADSGAFDDSGTYSQPESETIACSLSSMLDSLETQA